jgi:hypothetical protein
MCYITEFTKKNTLLKDIKLDLACHLKNIIKTNVKKSKKISDEFTHC